MGKCRIAKRIPTYSHQVIEEDQNIPYWEEPGDLDPSQFLDDSFHCPQVVSRQDHLFIDANILFRVVALPFQVEKSA